jgi:hypothetical protein
MIPAGCGRRTGTRVATERLGGMAECRRPIGWSMSYFEGRSRMGCSLIISAAREGVLTPTISGSVQTGRTPPLQAQRQALPADVRPLVPKGTLTQRTIPTTTRVVGSAGLASGVVGWKNSRRKNSKGLTEGLQSSRRIAVYGNSRPVMLVAPRVLRMLLRWHPLLSRLRKSARQRPTSKSKGSKEQPTWPIPWPLQVG